MKVKIPGMTTMIGSPETILRLIHDARLMDNLEGDDLIQEITHTVWRAYNIGLQVEGDTYAERAESLLREMNKHHMVEIEEEE